MRVASFGSYAELYVARLQHELELDLLVFDDTNVGDALTGSFDRAYLPGSFMAVPVIPDRRALAAFDAATEVLTGMRGYSERRRSLERLRKRDAIDRGKPFVECETFSAKERDSIRDVLLTADAVVFRSWTELHRVARVFSFQPVRAYRAVAAPATPAPRFTPRNGAGTVVVWAPEITAPRAALFAFALEELRAPAVIVCADITGSADLCVRARFIAIHDSDSLAALDGDTAALVAADHDDPAAALALAACGLPVAACFGSGAFEYVDGLYAFDAWDDRSILNATLAALGGEPPRCRSNVPRAADLVEPATRLGPPDLSTPPLVSIIVPTRNRHGVLPRAIDSLARQTYSNREVIVINDGGRPVDAIVERLPEAIVVNHPTSIGPTAAVNAGMRMATGTYLVLLSDDDYLFPTHISRLVYALERTGGSAAAGMCAESYLSAGDDDYYDYIGTSIRPFRATDPTVLQTVPTSMAISAMAVRRSTAERLGDLSADFPVHNDYEWHLRFIAEYDFIWISHLVTNMDSRLDRSNESGKVSSGDRTTDLARIWAHHPQPDRPDIAAAREFYLALNCRAAPAYEYPLYRGVTRLTQPRRAYRLD